MRSITFMTAALAATALAAALPLGCEGERRALADEPTYRDGVAALLDAKCARCHAGAAPAAGYRTDSYRGAIGCTASGERAVLPADAAPLLRALDRADHRELVTPEERPTLARWVASGTQSVRSGVHPPGFADPRSPSGHAQALRSNRYRSLTEAATDLDACARCHEGAGPRPADVTLSAPGATPCTSCHAEPEGVNACSTCHGAPGRPFPPRDDCFTPGETTSRPIPTTDPHAAHAAASTSRVEGLDCAACHPKPTSGSFDRTHTDGYVEVWFDHAVAGREAQFDSSSRRCTGTCHDRGGARPGPTWARGAAALGCNDCHGSPPPAHYAGPCSSCHREANAPGTALAAPRLHVNGKVDLGDGSGRCGACHGSGDSPWPTTGAHAAHVNPAGAAPVACETCHSVPAANEKHPLRAGTPVVRLAGLATKGGAPAVYDPATKTCSATYCHGGRGALLAAPKWSDGAAARTCGSCHSTPPPAPHPQDASCGASTCHDGITSGGLTISAAGRAVHVNGFVDRRVP